MTHIDRSQLDRIIGGAGPWKAIATGVAAGSLLALPAQFTEAGSAQKRQIAAAGATWGGTVGWTFHHLKGMLR